MKFKFTQISALKREKFKQTLLEGFFVAIFFIIAFVLREVPPSLDELEKKQQNQTYLQLADNFTENKSFALSPVTNSSEISNQTTKKKNYSHLKKRNVFTPEGSYSEIEIPDTPYVLVAVKLGKPNQALLRLFTGEIITVKPKDLLLDGAKVVKINKNSVIIERLGKKKELYIFHYEVERWKPKSW
ncbi:MAG: hypothetical protein ACK40E_03785 [Caldimicrobium sp.]